MESQIFNAKFYASLYNDIANIDPIDIHNHWVTVGSKGNRIGNVVDYVNVMIKLVQFDSDIYLGGNLSPDFRTTLAECVQSQVVAKPVVSLFSKSAQTPKVQQFTLANTPVSIFNSFFDKTSGFLYTDKKMYLINEVDIHECKNKWDNIYKNIITCVKFDWEFYNTYYPSNLTTSVDIFKNWLTSGLFSGNMPNKDTSVNVRMCISDISKNIGFDWTYVAKTYGNDLLAYHNIKNPDATEQKGLDSEIDVFWLFINYGKVLHMCLNEDEYNAYVKLNTDRFNAGMESINKKTNVTDIVKFANAHAHKLLKMTKEGLILKVFNIKPKTIDGILNASYVSDLLSKKNIEMFKIAKGIPLDAKIEDVINAIIKNELVKFNLDRNQTISLQTKEFITTLLYNGLMHLKQDKNEYNEIIKTAAVKLFQDIVSDLSEDEAKSIELDINFLFREKKIIKLCSTVSKVKVLASVMKLLK